MSIASIGRADFFMALSFNQTFVGNFLVLYGRELPTNV